MNLTTPKSPLKSQSEKYSWVLGEPLSVLPPKKKTSVREVLRYWIHISDTKTAGGRPLKCGGLSPESKNQDLNLVVKSLMRHWSINEFGDMKSELSIRTKLNNVIKNKVEEKLKMSKNQTKLFDFEFIEKTRREFDSIFDLSQSATPKKMNIRDPDLVSNKCAKP